MSGLLQKESKTVKSDRSVAAAQLHRLNFGDGEPHSLEELERYEALLLGARRSDRLFSDALRTDKSPAEKLRRDELAPFLAFARHEGLPPATIFWKPVKDEGVDIKYRAYGQERELQLTTAYPLWEGASNGGYDNRLSMEKLSATGGFIGSGPFKRVGAAIIPTERPTSQEQVEKACEEGLISAFAKKSSHGDARITLLVYAVHFFPAVCDFGQFQTLIDSSLRNSEPLRFGRVVVIDPVGGFACSI
jgi:hypothetical protein